MSRKNKTIAIVFLLALAAGCASVNKLSLKNLAYLYHAEVAFTTLPAVVYHSGDTTSLVIAEINLGDMRYISLENTGLKACSYRLGYRLLNNYDAYEVLDSGSVVSGDTLNAGKRITVLQSIQIMTKEDDKYLLELVLTDLNRKESVRNFIPIDKSSSFVRQNFMVVNPDNYPVFTNYIEPEEKVSIMCNDPMVNKLFVRCYFRDFPIARPPFVEERQDVFNYRADSTFAVPVLNGRTALFTLEREGFYHFQKDTAVKQGLTIFRFYKGFPEIKTTAQLVNPLRYISSKDEYDAIEGSSDQKEAVDQFWLKTAGNPARAKTLIQKYYSHVEEANALFSSYQEGWKTDRGIIYIIFGKPDYVYRGSNQEEWLYGEPENRNSLRFSYIKVRNPFTDDDFMLVRSPSYKDPWYITVQSWRR